MFFYHQPVTTHGKKRIVVFPMKNGNNVIRNSTYGNSGTRPSSKVAELTVVCGKKFEKKKKIKICTNLKIKIFFFFSTNLNFVFLSHLRIVENS